MPVTHDCSVEGCVRPYLARGYCGTHYAHWRRHGYPVPKTHQPAVCSVKACGSTALARGLCSRHYARWRTHGDPLAPRAIRMPGEKRLCAVPECDRDSVARSYCMMHYRRWRHWGDPARRRRPSEQRYPNRDGYVLAFRPDHANARGDGYILEHRLVMADSLGRPLTSTEIVHHRNGNRQDNRIENLQLLTRETHPTGHEHVTCPSCGHAFEVVVHDRP